MAHDGALVEPGFPFVVYVQVRTTDGSPVNLHNDIGWVLNLRIRNGLIVDVHFAVECQCLHLFFYIKIGNSALILHADFNI